MLSLLKKKNKSVGALSVPNWHPNFRNFKKLPDIKVVRTAFFINVGAFSVLFLLAAFLGFSEWQVRGLRAQVALEQLKIDRDKKLSDLSVAQFKKFQAEETRAIEVENFIKSKPNFSPLILRLAETLPPNIAIDIFDLRDSGATIRFSVRGAPETAPGYATAYLEKLKLDKQLALFDEFNFTATPSINPGTGRLAVEFSLRLRGSAGVKK